MMCDMSKKFLSDVKKCCHSMLRFFFVPVFFVMVSALSGHAQTTIEFEDFVNDYEGTRDTFFRTGNPVAFDGANDRFEWDGSDGGGMNYGLLQFMDIVGSGSNQIPPNSTILNAVILMEVVDPGDASTIHDLLIPFNEDGDLVEFNGGEEPVPGRDYDATPLSNVPNGVTGITLEAEVTISVQKIVNGGDNLGWIFIPGGGGGLEVASRESLTPPRLVVLFAEGAIPTARRSFSSSFFDRSDSITVSIAVELAAGSADITVLETIPAGWGAANISDGGLLSGSVITWNLPGFSGTGTISYNAISTANPTSGVLITGTINGLDVFGDSVLAFSPPFIHINDPNPVVVLLVNGEAFFEVEDGYLTVTPADGSPHFSILFEPSLRNQFYAANNVGTTGAVILDNRLDFYFEVTEPGDYAIITNTRTPDGSSDSFWIGMDNDEPITDGNFDRFQGSGTQDNDFHVSWLTTDGEADKIWFLEAGVHVFNLYSRETNSQIDWLVITNDLNQDVSAYTPPPFVPPAPVEDFMLY